MAKAENRGSCRIVDGAAPGEGGFIFEYYGEKGGGGGGEELVTDLKVWSWHCIVSVVSVNGREVSVIASGDAEDVRRVSIFKDSMKIVLAARYTLIESC